MIRDFSVRRLAEFACRCGDLYPPTSGVPVDAEDGIRVQKAVQAQRSRISPNYRKEVSLGTEFHLLGVTKMLKGRADGLFVDEREAVVEEYKCTNELPSEPDPVDMGQALIYAGLWALDNDQEQINVRLVYVNRDDLGEVAFVQSFDRAQAILILTLVLTCYEARMRRHQTRVAARQDWAASAPFPYSAYRPGQRAIARRAYVAIKQRENLLLEAPTGSGKTMAILYPAIRAQDEYDQLFFLTNRTSGARAALDAVKDIDSEGRRISTVELTAKEKICLVEGMPCDAEQCSYAKGYFDRVQPAVTELLQLGLASREKIIATATKHTVCPFELSLDAALWSDVIVGDYNYAFDPVVRLQRFNGHPDLHLLIDEAHNLSARAQDMLSVAIYRDVLKRAKSSADGPLAKRIESVDRALMEIRRALDPGEHTIEDVGPLERSLTRLVDAAAELEIARSDKALLALIFDAHRWLRSAQWYDENSFTHTADVTSDRGITVKRVCLDTAGYTKQLMAEHGAVVRFSGTVSPLALYQRLHGGDVGFSERGQTPFDSAQVEVLIVGDIPTYYQSRQASLAKLAGLVEQTILAQDGRYLVALPSYAYLGELVGALRDGMPEGYELFAQAPGLTTEAREALLEDFCTTSKALFCVVMGGVFSESVDFSETSLAGVLLVGIGLPPPTLQRNLVAAYFEHEAGKGWGQLTAFIQPAMSKIVQAAGRLIRSPKDRGVICLIDPRYHDPRFQRFFPAYWQPRALKANQVPRVLRAFWDGATIATANPVDQHEHSTH